MRTNTFYYSSNFIQNIVRSKFTNNPLKFKLVIKSTKECKSTSMCFVLNVLELGLRGALSSFCFFIVSLLSFVLWPWKFYAFSTRAEWRFCQLLTLKLYVRWHTCNVKHQFIKECFCNAFIYPKFYYLLKKTNH